MVSLMLSMLYLPPKCQHCLLPLKVPLLQKPQLNLTRIYMGPFQQSSYPRSHPYYHHIANPGVSAATGLTTTTALPTTSYNVKHWAHSVLPPLPYSLPFPQCLYFYPAISPTSAVCLNSSTLHLYSTAASITTKDAPQKQKQPAYPSSKPLPFPFFSPSPLYPGKPDKSPVTSLAKGEQPQPNPPGFLPLQSPPYPVAHLPYPFCRVSH